MTAVLLTSTDTRMSRLQAGQALQRLLLHAATKWVFASLLTQPLENAVTRDLIRARLALPGSPQMLLQLGRAANAPADRAARARRTRRPVTHHVQVTAVPQSCNLRLGVDVEGGDHLRDPVVRGYVVGGDDLHQAGEGSDLEQAQAAPGGVPAPRCPACGTAARGSAGLAT